jgi:hypothetical protein
VKKERIQGTDVMKRKGRGKIVGEIEMDFDNSRMEKLK